MSTPSVTVVIPHYFKERRDHLARIIDDLQQGSHPPAEIIIWNNDPDDNLTLTCWNSRPGVSIVQSPRNLGCQARIHAALLAQSDYLLFIDNDVTVESETVASLLAWSMRYSEAIVTLEGRTGPSVDAPYKKWPKTFGDQVASPTPVTMSLARGEMMPRRRLLNLLPHFPFGPDGEMDDLWWSACAAIAGVPIYVVPAERGRSSLRNLPRFGTGASATDGYYQARDRAVAEIRRRHPQVWSDQ